MKEKYLKSLIVIVIVGILLVLFVSNKIMRPKSNELPEVRLKEIINKDKSFAIMIQSKNGYKEYDSDTWPGSSYKFKEAKCIDNNGDEVKEAITYEEGKITLTTNKTVYCTVYFDYKGTINILRENDSNKNLSLDIQGDMYRYQASFPECDNESECENAAKMTNWICFGTTNNCGTDDDNVNKYMYRIIGVTKEGQLYLLKETFIKEKETKATSFAWNSKKQMPDCYGEICEWPNSDIYKRLNGKTSNGNPIFINNAEYEYMLEENDWYNLIEEHNWMYGDTIASTYNSDAYSGNYMYAIETGKAATTRYWPDEGHETCSSDSLCTIKPYTWTKSMPAKIGLMYVHDIDYAYTGGNPSSFENVKNSWIHFQKDGYNSSPTSEWLITHLGPANVTNPSADAWRITNEGKLGNLNHGTAFGIRPTFYLSSEIKIASGEGTKSNPYIIEV